MNKRVSSGCITELADDEIFVFGSNESGLHGGGAAKLAMKWGAVWGKADGIQGKTYALPTVKKGIRGPLPVKTIERHVNNFIECAQNNPKLKFLVTEVGCGLAGLTVDEIAPLFKNALVLENVYLPLKFHRVLQHIK